MNRRTRAVLDAITDDMVARTGEVFAHTHLGHQRLEPGECAACDVAWEVQAVRLAGGVDKLAIDRKRHSQDRRVARCPAMWDGELGGYRAGHHVCDLPIGHAGSKHDCPLCHMSWP